MIATTGEALIDLIEQADGSFRACLGGSVCNFTLGLARQGMPATYLNPLSADRFGERFATLFEDNGVHVAASARSPLPTSMAAVGLDAEGIPSYSFYRAEVADRDVSAEQLAARFPASMRLLHTGGLALVPGEADKTISVMEAAARADALISVDLNLRKAGAADLESYRQCVLKAVRGAHVIKASDEDLHHLGFGNLSIVETGKAIFENSVAELVALTLGSRGAVLITRSAHLHVAAPAGLAVVDTVGAGDCFHAGLIAYLDRAGVLASRAALAGIDAACLAGALRHAIASASLNVMRAGCQPPTWDEAQMFARTLS